MKYIKILCLLLGWIVSIPAMGQFNPANPPEPSQPQPKYKLVLKADLPTGGTVSGGGSYEFGQKVSVSASPNSGFVFEEWVDEYGASVNLKRSFSYVMPQKDVVLTARFRYDPSNPSEPDKPNLDYANVSISVTPFGGGSVSGAGRYLVGSKVRLSASSASGFNFNCWIIEGDTLSAKKSFDYEVRPGNNNLVAKFTYSPGNPSEPSVPVVKHRLTLRSLPSGSGYFNVSSGSEYEPGQTVNITANANSGFVFIDWTDEKGEVISDKRTMGFTMPATDAELTARFRYSPSNPTEPSDPEPRRNVIYGQKLSSNPGSASLFDISLENLDRIVGIAVDIRMPEGVTADYSSILTTERSSGHTVSTQNAGNGFTRLLVSGTEPFAGIAGALLRIPVVLGRDAEPGSSFTVDLAKGVVYRLDGSQDPVDAIDGIIRIADSIITLPDSPDFVVEDISVKEGGYRPGDLISIGWKVANRGVIAASAGWKETISFVDAAGNRSSLANLYYETQSFKPGEEVVRSADIAIPGIPGIDGNLDVSVTLTPFAYSGEIEDMQLNNTAKTDARPVKLSKVLLLEVPERLNEGEKGAARCRIVRSGLWNTSETFNLNLKRGDSRLVFPATVTIPRNQSAAYFTVSVKDNLILDESDAFSISVEGNGYPETVANLVIVDNETPSVVLVSSKDFINEGESATLTVKLPRKVAEDTKIWLTTDYPRLLSVPAFAVIPVGESEASVEIQVADNNSIDGDKEVDIYAADGSQKLGETYITVIDNDMPNLSLEISPKEISEGGGPYAARGILSRSDNFESKVTVRLSDDADGRLIIPYRELTLAPGVESVEFSIGVADNQIVDGDREITLTAAVYISSCKCTANGNRGGSVSEKLLIIDDDGPALTLSVSSSTLAEGDDRGIWLTVSRNTDVSLPVDVNISADNAEGLVFDTNVIIPIGDRSARIKVTAPQNLSVGDGKTIVFTAEAKDYAKGTCWVMLTDNTLPDAGVKSLELSADEAVVGDIVEVTATIVNTGSIYLPEMMPLAIYADGVLVRRMYLQQPLPPGGETVLTGEVSLPDKVGRCEIYGTVNEDRQIKETLYTNNRSESKFVIISAPYSLTVTADKAIYSPGDSVRISGKVVSGRVEDQVEIFILNKGSRQTMLAQPDEKGEFNAVFTPYPGQLGVFSAGACYPGSGDRSATASFEIPGLRLVTESPATVKTTTGETAAIRLEFRNESTSTLTKLEATVDTPAGWNIETDIPKSVGPGCVGVLDFKCTSSEATAGDDWLKSKVVLTAENGISLHSTLYLYSVEPRGRLSADVARIETNITAGKETLYPITVTNKGKGETGTISVDLPEWMTSVTPISLPSLAYGESTQIVLNLSVTDRMNLNHLVTGHMGITCANGTGISIGYSVTPVSEEKGTLIVEAADEYTYNTDEAPLVKGASVILYNPATDKEVFSGVTADDGVCTLDIEAGYYRLSVSADRHEPFADYVFVSPGNTTTVRADIGYNPITIGWNMTETSVEDEYEIETTVIYETDVPMPVVKIDIPKRIDGDNMVVGDAVLINMTLTNVGLIKALNVTPVIPMDLTEWKFEILDNAGPFDLAAQQSKEVPIRITRIADLSDAPSKTMRRGPGETLVNTFGNCMTAVGSTYQAMCGKKLRDNEAAETLALKMCATSATMNMIGDILGTVFSGFPSLPGVLGGPGGGGSGGGGSSSIYDNPTGGTNAFSICNECDAQKALQLIDSLLGMTWMGDFNEMLNETIERYRAQGREIVVKERPIWQRVRDTAREIAGELLPDDWGNLAGLAFDIYEVTRPCDQYENDHPNAPAKAPAHSWITDFENTSDLMVAQLNASRKFMEANLGDSIWWTSLDLEKADFIDYVLSLPDGAMLTDDEIIAVKPSSVSLAQARAAVENMMGRALPAVSDDDYSAIASEFEAVEAIAVDKGFSGYAELYDEAYNNYKRHFDELKNNSVCASVTLKISQQMTLTRQAFRGYLTVFNGHESRPISDLRLNLVVRDQKGNVATAREFQINPENIDGFTGELNLMSGWELSAGLTGNASILFIPTRYAAPEEDVVYSFGGSISYMDPYNDMMVTRTLFPVEMTVRPTPELELTYFMQRDVVGDDPMTSDVVEASVPSEFALVINNVGFGDAQNVRMTTSRPEVVENEKGLPIEMDFISSQLNGADAVLPLGEKIASEFGDIAAHSTAYAQWWLRSNILGHFTDYDVTVNHLTSFGNPNLSLITDVKILELIHGFTPADSPEGMPARAFLVNEVSDSEDEPDMVYFSTGESAVEVSPAYGNIVAVDDNVYELTVGGDNRWMFGTVPDPTSGRQKLVHVERASDGVEIPVDNFWQTGVTLRDGKLPVHEAMLRFVCATESGETYRLTFESCPLVALQVESFSGCPDKNGIVKEQVKNVVVRFNKPIDVTTFDADDVTLRLEGESLDVEGLPVSIVDASTLSLDLSAYTVNDGYYVLEVMTDGILDLEGFNGVAGASTSWVQYVDGMVGVTVVAVPAEGGMVTPKSCKAEFGVPLALTATPNHGFRFDGWWVDGKEYSSMHEIEFIPLNETLMEARFSPYSGVEAMEADGRLRIWPLPLNEVIHVEGDFRTIGRLSFYTVEGRCQVEVRDVVPGAAIDIEMLPAGIYIVNVETENGVFHMKVMKR